MFPIDLTNGGVSSLFKKDDNICKKNYRPISLLHAISKFFERLLFNQLYNYIRQLFSPLLGGFREGYSTRHVFLNLLQHCKNSIDNMELAGHFSWIFQEAFDSVQHDLLIAKVNAYELELDSFQLIRNYLFKRHQRVKVNDTFSA